MMGGRWRILPVILLCVAFFGCSNDPVTADETLVYVETSQTAWGNRYFFVSNRFLDTIYRINLDSLDVAEIKVGKAPKVIAGSPDGSTIAVANGGSETISFVDTETLEKRSRKVNGTPGAIAFSNDGKNLAVAITEPDTVLLIDTETYDGQTSHACSDPVALDFSPDGLRLSIGCFRYGVRELSIKPDGYRGSYDVPYVQAIKNGKEGSVAEGLLFVGTKDYYDDIDNTASIYALIRDLDAEDFDRQYDEFRIPAAENTRQILFNHDGDKLIALHNVKEGDDEVSIHLIQDDQEKGHLFPLQSSVIVHKSPVFAALHPRDDRLAVACRNSDVVELIDLDLGEKRTVRTEPRPGVLAYSPDGETIIVIHDTPLMPVSLINAESGKARVLFDSLSMAEWLD